MGQEFTFEMLIQRISTHTISALRMLILIIPAPVFYEPLRQTHYFFSYLIDFH